MSIEYSSIEWILNWCIVKWVQQKTAQIKALPKKDSPEWTRFLWWRLSLSHFKWMNDLPTYDAIVVCSVGSCVDAVMARMCVCSCAST